MTSSISIICPTLNEEGAIPAISRLQDSGCEVIIVDGGSRDQTQAQARAHGLSLLEVNGGRGCQQNEGARLACGNILLFLHADTRLPDDFIPAISRCLADQRVVAGAFSRGSSWRLSCATVNSSFHVPT